jgi:hypothetical protein
MCLHANNLIMNYKFRKNFIYTYLNTNKRGQNRRRTV